MGCRSSKILDANIKIINNRIMMSDPFEIENNKELLIKAWNVYTYLPKQSRDKLDYIAKNLESNIKCSKKTFI
jgi:hypothetical protein